MDDSHPFLRRYTAALVLAALAGCAAAKAGGDLPPPLGLPADPNPAPALSDGLPGSAAAMAHGPEAAHPPADVMRFITLGRVGFESGKWDLSDTAKRALDVMADYLAAHPGAGRLLLEGHADELGRNDYNDKLSDQRTVAVQDYLAGKGVDARLIHRKGHGKRSPTDENWNRLGRRRNRQVELFAVYLTEDRRQRTEDEDRGRRVRGW
jgi:outer membrane protein OmpA-like peptidoglycan-associated protein